MSYPYQEPINVCASDEAVKAAFGASRVRDEFAGNDRFDKTARVLGNPILKSFADANIVKVELPGFGPNKSRTQWVSVNRKLKPLFLTAFEKILAARVPYVLHEAGAYLFRYMQNPGVKAALINRPEYAAIKQQPGFNAEWNIRCAEFDREHQLFDELVTGYKSGNRRKKDLLSNHAFGSAIDINWGTNPYKAGAQFDMPRKIVEIFEGLGFNWGGYYHDYMHFEYLRATIVELSDELPPTVLYPFQADPQQRESPLKYYFLNEGGSGGYFPLGKQQNLHAGVHLEPDSPEALVPVKAAMPGYIIAARLMTPGKEGDNALLLEATEGRPLGFVLVRHELTKPPRPAQPGEAASGPPPEEEVHPLYSLYMHLAPPEWGGAEGDKAFEKVPWLASFLRMQHGAVVNLDPATEDAGKSYWAKAPLNPEAESFQVQERSAPLLGKKDGKVLSLTKPSPKAVGEAIESLKKGSVITFDRPLFPVAAGETLGFLAPGRAIPAVGGAAAAGSRRGPPPRYLHWELFSPSGDGGGLQFLAGEDTKLKELLLQVEEQERKDNFLQMPSDGAPGAGNDVNAILGSTGVDIVQELKRARYGRKLQEYFNDGTKFFQAEGTTETPFTWPLKLTLENKYKFAGDPTKPCTLEVLYKRAGQPLSQESFTLSPRKDQATLDVTLNVPAQADGLALWSPVFFADRVEVPPNVLRDKRIQSRTELFKKAARHRWRNLVLDHVNEWTPQGLEAQLKARIDAQLFEDVQEDPEALLKDLKKQLLPLCWWARPATREDPFGEVPVLVESEGNSLFGDSGALLPKDATVVNMHPVTALWVVDLLLEQELIALKKQWPPYTLTRDESTDKPPFLGLLSKEPSLLAGMDLLAVLVQHGYATTPGAGVTDVTFWLGPQGGADEAQVLCHAAYKDGVALGRIRAPSWGRWEVYATGAEGKRLEPVQTLGTAFEVPKPVLTGQPFTLGSKAGTLRPLATGAFVVKENWPAALAGYVAFDYWKVPPKGQPDLTTGGTDASLAVPALASRPPAERTAGGLKFKGEYIIGLEKKKTNPKVTPNFTFQEFVKHPRLGQVFEDDAESKFVLSVSLAQRLQELRELCKPKNARTKDLSLVVKWLRRDGLELLVGPSSGTAADLELLVAKLPLLKPSELFAAERDDEEVAVLLKYTPPGVSTGPLHLEFDPAPALGRLAADLLGDAEPGVTLHVRPRFIAPNSGHALHTSGKLTPVEGVTGLFSASALAIQAACGQDFLEAVADKCLPPVARFEFGDIQVKMGAGKLRTEVKLHGDATQWKLAEPVFKLAGAVQNRRATGLLQADWPLMGRNGQRLPEMWGGELEFTAEAAQAGKVTAPPPPVKVKVKVEPRLEKLTHELKGKLLCLKGQGHFIPTDSDFRIICERLDPATGQWAEHEKVTSSLHYTNAGDAHHGRCTDLGVFEATVPQALLKKVGGSFRFFWRRRVNRSGAALPVLGAVLEEPPALELTDAELGP
jgi:hypothetical protein